MYVLALISLPQPWKMLPPPGSLPCFTWTAENYSSSLLNQINAMSEKKWNDLRNSYLPCLSWYFVSTKPFIDNEKFMKQNAMALWVKVKLTVASAQPQTNGPFKEDRYLQSRLNTSLHSPRAVVVIILTLKNLARM